MKPYYDHKGITIYHGDCLEILPQIEPVDLVLTDPPYDDYHTDLYMQTPIDFLKRLGCKQLVFWSAKTEFPLSYTAIHIWHKKNAGCASQYERIFERQGGKEYKVFAYCSINNQMSANYERDVFWGHPSQKPLNLIKRLIGKGQFILDPFMGSGTTLVAAKELNCRAIGIEIEEKWCEVAARRLAQEMLPFGSNQSLEADGQKDGHRSA